MLSMQSNIEPKISPLGDAAIRVQYGNEISPAINSNIRNFALLLKQEQIEGVTEWIPTYTAVTILYNPSVTSYTKLVERIEELYRKIEKMEVPTADVFYIPTYYGAEEGPDIETVANHNGLSVDEVIRIHSETEYLIYMMGFTPGFPYLGGMSKKIATPRLQTPRKKIHPGSVGIAGEQTGIYSMETPGGWQLIGRTPLRLYDANQKSPMLLQAGNYLKFVPISKKEYEAILVDVEAGTYIVDKKHHKPN